jgi:hypothetical protein
MPIRLTAQQLSKFKNPVYKRVEAFTKVPAEIIFAIHYRERGLQVGVSNIMQFDPRPSKSQVKDLYQKYSTLAPAQIDKYTNAGLDDFEAAAILAGCFIRHKGCKWATDDQVKDAFWAYNGRFYGSSDKSPYVMNGFDAKHENMVIHGTIEGKPIHITDKNAGAFVVYKQLKGEI